MDKINSSAIKFRALEQCDLEVLYRARNNRELRSTLGGPFRHISADVELDWINKEVHNQNSVRLMIEKRLVNTEPEIIGMVNLTGINWVDRSAEFGIQIWSEDRGKGVGTIATNYILNHGFNDLNLHRIYLYVLTDNSPAIRVYEKVGFVQEGLLRQSAFKNGKYVDKLVMGILSNEFINKNNS